MTTVNFTWTHEVEQKEGEFFVIERQDGVPGFTRFGPMPADFTGPFVDERREFLQDSVRSAKSRLLDQIKGKN